MNRNSAYLLNAQYNSHDEISPADSNKGFTCQELYALIGDGCDMVEVVELANGMIMILDEEGALKDDKIKNELATELFRQGRTPSEVYKLMLRAEWGDAFYDMDEGNDDVEPDTIYGNVVICHPDMFK